ncbi:hypothetical protein ACJX0J_024773, partial [Zea mays]
ALILNIGFFLFCVFSPHSPRSNFGLILCMLFVLLESLPTLSLFYMTSIIIGFITMHQLRKKITKQLLGQNPLEFIRRFFLQYMYFHRTSDGSADTPFAFFDFLHYMYRKTIERISHLIKPLDQISQLNHLRDKDLNPLGGHIDRSYLLHEYMNV